MLLNNKTNSFKFLEDDNIKYFNGKKIPSYKHILNDLLKIDKIIDLKIAEKQNEKKISIQNQ